MRLVVLFGDISFEQTTHLVVSMLSRLASTHTQPCHKQKQYMNSAHFNLHTMQIIYYCLAVIVYAWASSLPKRNRCYSKKFMPKEVFVYRVSAHKRMCAIFDAVCLYASTNAKLPGILHMKTSISSGSILHHTYTHTWANKYQYADLWYSISASECVCVCASDVIVPFVWIVCQRHRITPCKTSKLIERKQSSSQCHRASLHSRILSDLQVFHSIFTVVPKVRVHVLTIFVSIWSVKSSLWNAGIDRRNG